MKDLSPWKGMTLAEIQESILIHEFMHYMGIVGPDRGGQSYTLPNGQRVSGSMEISQAVKDNCFK